MTFMAPPRYEQIMQQVLSDVRQGHLKPGARVASEAELAQQFGVSRITSRKALDELAQIGIVNRQRGKGTFVAAQLPDLEDALPQQATGTPVRDWLIGLILPDFSEVFGLRLLHGIEAELRSAGRQLLVWRTLDRQDAEQDAVRELRALGVSGLIVFPVHGEHYNPALLQAVLDHYPVVLVDRYLRGIPVPSVGTDNRAAAELLTRHLLDLGHRRIAFLSPPLEHTSTLEERLAGFSAALLASGAPFDEALVLSSLTSTLPTGADDKAGDEAALATFLTAHPDVTAFFVSEYNLAVTLTRALTHLGLRVPQDVSVVCFDTPYHTSTQFTHIQQDEDGIGRSAVRQLLERLTGTDNTAISVIPFTLVPGATSAPPRTLT